MVKSCIDVRIAVIMSTYNEEEQWLRASIESILSQSWDNLRFYILLDNPANGAHKRVVEEYAERDDRIVFMVNERNLGLVGSLNKLLSCVEEGFVARMDADDVAHPERLAKEMRFMQGCGLDVVGVGSDILFTDGRKTAGRSFPLLLADEMRQIEGKANIIAHSGWLVRKQVYDDLGGYRPVAHCEDYDFLLRALQKGFRLGRLDETLLTVRYNEDGISIPYAFMQDAWATCLRKAFSKGDPIEEIDAESKSRELELASVANREAYGKARKRMDDCASYLYEGAWARCGRGILGGFLASAAFRKLLLNAVAARIGIAHICRKVQAQMGASANP